MQHASFCSGDSVCWMERERERRGVLQHVEGPWATILSTEGLIVTVAVGQLARAVHEPSGIIDVRRL